MKKIFFLMTLFLITNTFAADDKETFKQLKQLEGKWVGTLKDSNGGSQTLNISYSIKSNGSALLEESNEGGTEMMTIFNLHNDKILSTHYCGAMNRPVSELQESNQGNINFITNQSKSGLDPNKEFFVGSWKFDLMPEDEDTFIYSYVILGTEGGDVTRTAEMKRVK
jgi:hypothetical protein|tara:strand:+ start:198 stop:698 length:501 start_codon:yes stop_codon:yes gene_type:complete